MLEKSRQTGVTGTDFIIFILRNLVLYGLVFAAYLHFQDDVNILFISIAFSCAIIVAVVMENIKLRLLPAILSVVLITLMIRLLIFSIFSFLSPLDAGPDTDFFYLHFDKDFVPAMLPAGIAWFFNFYALRKPGFIHFEIGCNALFLLGIFFSQANYNITMFHPTFFGLFLGVYVLIEITILLLTFRRKNRNILKVPKNKNKAVKQDNTRQIFSYLWIIVPLILLLIFYLFLMEAYNKESTKSRGGLMESTLFRFDFSKYLKLKSEIKLSDDLVMIMRKNGPASRLLLRRFVLSEYDPKGGFYQSQKRGIDDIPVIVPDSTTVLSDPGYKSREIVTQEYFFINLDPTSLIAMNYPVKIMPLKNWEDSSFLRIYKVESKVSQLDLYDALLMEVDGPQLPGDLYSFYTNYGDDERIKEMAQMVTEYSYSYFEQVLDIRDYLQDNYLYSLKPGIAKDGDQLSHFLFESKKGYCSYFAFAMALLCRSIGIPARVVVGFVSFPEWEVLNFYEIKANQAHAWVEVYFKDLGWIEFDPTSSTIAPGEDISFMFNFQMDDKLKSLLTEILENQDKLVEEEASADGALKRSRDVMYYVAQISGWLTKYWFIVFPCLYFIIIVFIKYFRLFIYFISVKPGKKIKSLFLYSMGTMYGLGIIRKPDESLGEYALRIEKDGPYQLSYFKPWLDIYLKAVFDREFTDPDYVKALQSYKNFKMVIKQNVPFILRFLGFLNPVHSLKRKT
ncbi:MAG: transglutaminase domain-containing protein [Spirochaetales bacterium]|nr:transglutaminase domain-containing protein [Spirochaetales bacterium]